MNINYNDLHKVYNQQLYNLTEDSNIEPTPTIEPEEPVEFYEPEPEPEPERIPRRRKRRKVYKTFYDDPLRDFLVTAGEFALGYGIAEKLRLFKKPSTYVGNQDITDMSDERVKEYRRIGLLPPPS